MYVYDERTSPSDEYSTAQQAKQIRRTNIIDKANGSQLSEIIEWQRIQINVDCIETI